MKKLLFAIILFSHIGCAQKEINRGYRVHVGEQAPSVSLTLQDGSVIDNASLLGKVVVLQFTASWCGVCKKEMPHLESEVWQRFKDDDFILIGIDLKENPEKVAKLKEDTGITYPMAIDKDGSLFEKFTLPNAGVTRNIVLDKAGKIIFLSRLYERKEFEQMIDTIDKELKKNSGLIYDDKQ